MRESVAAIRGVERYLCCTYQADAEPEVHVVERVRSKNSHPVAPCNTKGDEPSAELVAGVETLTKRLRRAVAERHEVGIGRRSCSIAKGDWNAPSLLRPPASLEVTSQVGIALKTAHQTS